MAQGRPLCGVWGEAHQEAARKVLLVVAQAGHGVLRQPQKLCRAPLHPPRDGRDPCQGGDGGVDGHSRRGVLCACRRPGDCLRLELEACPCALPGLAAAHRGADLRVQEREPADGDEQHRARAVGGGAQRRRDRHPQRGRLQPPVFHHDPLRQDARGAPEERREARPGPGLRQWLQAVCVDGVVRGCLLRGRALHRAGEPRVRHAHPRLPRRHPGLRGHRPHRRVRPRHRQGAGRRPLHLLQHRPLPLRHQDRPHERRAGRHPAGAHPGGH
mmetsp:Transcript_19301/g.44442  ORF Transcript_19301/g.44442 Transcript_19301/m.44442 type:complete len:271 (+) Transcript_19301:469-1281(+)